MLGRLESYVETADVIGPFATSVAESYTVDTARRRSTAIVSARRTSRSPKIAWAPDFPPRARSLRRTKYDEHGGITHGLEVGVLRHLLDVLLAQKLGEVGLAGEQAQHRRVRAARDTPDDAIDFRTSAMEGGVGIHFNRAATHPAHELVRAAAHRVATECRRGERGIRNALQEMRGEHANLHCRVVELLERARVKPEHRRETIACRDGIDVRDAAASPESRSPSMCSRDSCTRHLLARTGTPSCQCAFGSR